MKLSPARWVAVLVPVAVVIAFIVVIALLPEHPIAFLQVVDAAGQPVRDAVITPEGLRTKSGPYKGNWYGWRGNTNMVAAEPVRTDKDGRARIPYPEFVFERIETGAITMSVEHPNFVPDRPERVVSTALPRGAPWRERLLTFVQGLRGRATSVTDPIVLQRGAFLTLTAVPTNASPNNRFFAQLSRQYTPDSNFWQRPAPNILTSQRVSPGSNTVRGILIDSNDVWFSDVISLNATTNQATELQLQFRRGVTVRGQLDAQVPRPVKNGRMVAHVWPVGHKPEHSPPQWHGWCPVKEDGTFEVTSLPSGQLEVVALCDGFVSTNGPRNAPVRYPQRHKLDWRDLEISIGMERTSRLEVQLTDSDGKPVKDAEIMTWPNICYGEWSSTVLMSDCYNMRDRYPKPVEPHGLWIPGARDFQGTSDASGLAVLPNVPVTVNSLIVAHPNFAVQIRTNDSGTKHRQVLFKLEPGATNRISVQLEPRDADAITHY